MNCTPLSAACCLLQLAGSIAPPSARAALCPNGWPRRRANNVNELVGLARASILQRLHDIYTLRPSLNYHLPILDQAGGCLSSWELNLFKHKRLNCQDGPPFTRNWRLTASVTDTMSHNKSKTCSATCKSPFPSTKIVGNIRSKPDLLCTSAVGNRALSSKKG